MDTDTIAQIERLERLGARLERLLDERTTNYASHTTLIVGGLQEDLQGLTEAVHQLNESVLGVRRDVAQLMAVATEARDISARQGADQGRHELRLRRLERGAGLPHTADVGPIGD